MKFAPNIVISLMLAFALGCSADDDAPTQGIDPSGKADTFDGEDPFSITGAIFGSSVLERPMVGEAFGTEGPTLFLVSSIHGNELSAITFGERVRAMLLGGLAERTGTRIFFVQSANPDGIVQGTRENFNYIDLNRNFPAENFDASPRHGSEPLTEPESRMLHDALNSTAPVGVVSIHCCIPTFDLDGPRIGLAEAMHDTMLQETGLDFTLDDLPAYGGSMGSYVSQILGKPIVTVEFDTPDFAPVELQLQGMEKSIESAALWAAAQPEAEPFAPGTLQPRDASNYASFEIGRSAGDLPIRAELLGDGEKRIAVLAGFGGREMRGEYAAEHLRSVIVGELPFLDNRTLYISGVNPDGLGLRIQANVDGVDLREDIGSPSPVSPEARAVQQAVLEHNPEIVVMIVDSDRDAAWSIGDIEELSGGMGLELVEPPADTAWVQPFVEAGSSVLVLEVNQAYAQSQGNFDGVSQVEFSAPLMPLF